MTATSVERLDAARPVQSVAESARQSFQIVDKNGLTMLKCSRLIEQFDHFAGKITISNGLISVNGRSMIDMLQLAAVVGTVITVELVGPNAEQLMKKIVPLLAN